MNEVAQHKTNEIQEQKNIRDGILEFEDMLSTCEGVLKGDNYLCPLKHSFAENIYVREITIPEGMILTGKIHLHSHPNFLMKGKVRVYTEFGGMEELEAPMSIISKAGTKRVVESLSDVTWVTIHSNPTNTQDLNELEKIVIAENYDEYDKFIENKNRWYNKILRSFNMTINSLKINLL